MGKKWISAARTAEKAERRLEHFHSNLSEIRAYLGDAIVEVDGTRSPSIVSKSMAKIIDNKSKSKFIAEKSTALKDRLIEETKTGKKFIIKSN